MSLSIKFSYLGRRKETLISTSFCTYYIIVYLRSIQTCKSLQLVFLNLFLSQYFERVYLNSGFHPKSPYTCIRDVMIQLLWEIPPKEYCVAGRNNFFFMRRFSYLIAIVTISRSSLRLYSIMQFFITKRI